MFPVLLAWLTRLLWLPRPTRKRLGLPPSIAARVVETLAALEEETPPEQVDAIHAAARLALSECLWERRVPEALYVLLVDETYGAHRVRRIADGCSWSLHELDDFIDLGLHPRGT